MILTNPLPNNVDELIERLTLTADSLERITAPGNYFFGTAGHIALFREAAKALSSPPRSGDEVERLNWRQAYRAWQTGPLSLGADPDYHELIEAGFKGGWEARNKLILRLIADADDEKAGADALSPLPSVSRDDEK